MLLVNDTSVVSDHFRVMLVAQASPVWQVSLVEINESSRNHRFFFILGENGVKGE